MSILEKIAGFFHVDLFMKALPNMLFGYLGIFLVTALIVICITVLNVLPAKIAERKAKKAEDDDDDE